MSWSQPSLNDFKARFVRDFPYAPATDPSNPDYVMDADITNAINQASVSFNDSIGAADIALTEMFLLLSAFFLVENLKTAQNGINSQSQFLVNSKGIGGVSVGYEIPELIKSNQILAKYKGKFSGGHKKSKTASEMTNAEIGAIHEFGIKNEKARMPQRSFLKMPLTKAAKELFEKRQTITKYVNAAIDNGTPIDIAWLKAHEDLGVIGQ